MRLAAVAGVARAGRVFVELSYAFALRTLRLWEAIMEQRSQTSVVVWIFLVELKDGKAHTVGGISTYYSFHY